MKKMDYNIMLIGFMGVGKTTVSKVLSKELNMPEVDMDAYIVRREKMEISDMFENYGEQYFRKVETDCLIEIQKEKGRIVSCGGGVVVKDENIKYMKDSGVILLLTATPQTIYERVKDSTNRPVLNGHMNIEYIEELMNKRKARYLEVADIVISTDNRNVKEIVEEIKTKLSEFAKK